MENWTFRDFILPSPLCPDAAHCATTTKRRPRKELDPILQIQRENPATSTLHRGFLLGRGSIFIWDTFQIGNQWMLKGLWWFCLFSANGILNPRSTSAHHLLAIPEKKVPTKNATRDPPELNNRGGYSMIFVDPVLKIAVKFSGS